MGSALTMILSTYLCAMLSNVWTDLPANARTTDVSRFGAQVINGIGFLGAGTIIVTGRQQIKGMTTAAGLWASACMGLAIGAGFYFAALVACFLIVLTIVVFSKIESFILLHSRNVNIYIEFENSDDIVDILAKFKSIGVRIFDVEMTKAKRAENKIPNAIITMRLPKKTPHTQIFSIISEIDTIRSIEEL
jgi:putative Mg2+ transporter-C (MgtC) family protein